MLDTGKLERRWLKYKIKSLLPYALLGIVIAFFALLILKMVLPTPSLPTQEPLPINHIAAKQTQTAQMAQDENRMILEPSMQFMQSMNSSARQEPSSTTVFSSIPPAKTVILDSSPAQLPPKNIPLPTVEKVPKPLAQSTLTTIKRDDAVFDIHEIEERFKNSSNPNLGLYIAHYHYDHGNYAEAYNYALKTNAINSTMDDSWLIFAKSLVKLGKAEQAKKTLQLYISNSNSQSAKNYLETLNKETSK